jgi:chromatin remodeling complex protein RSC6
MRYSLISTSLALLFVLESQIFGLTLKAPVYAQAPSISQQENAANDWKKNATPQEKQDAERSRQQADSAFQKNATPQEKQQASTMHQQAHNDASQDRANPSASREASQEHAAGKEARGDANADRGSHSHGHK